LFTIVRTFHHHTEQVSGSTKFPIQAPIKRLLSRAFIFKERRLHHPINYRNEDFLSSIMNLTDIKGVELVIDPIGGKNWKKSYRALRSTGRLGMFGVSTVTD
jgi:D-arabinose 1-dehydrogenase-like Zn-dependent alcohol dehydrogenase